MRNRDRLSDHVQHAEGIVHSRRTGAETSTEDISGSPGASGEMGHSVTSALTHMAPGKVLEIRGWDFLLEEGEAPQR